MTRSFINIDKCSILSFIFTKVLWKRWIDYIIQLVVNVCSWNIHLDRYLLIFTANKAIYLNFIDMNEWIEGHIQLQ